MRSNKKIMLKNEDIIKQIEFNYKMSLKLKKRINYEKNSVQKLELLKYLIHFDINYFTGKYSDEWIENKLAEYGRTIKFERRKLIQQGKVLHVITAAYDTGGHTQIVNNWILSTDNASNAVVFTNSEMKSVPEYLYRTTKITDTKIFFLRKNNDIEKAKELLRISECFDKIVLHIHMFDIVPIIAYSNLKWDRPIYFYNHANFLFSLGMSISDLVLCVYEYDKKKALKYRGANKANVLEVIPYSDSIEDNKIDNSEKQILKQILSKKYGFAENSKIILSMGEEFKYQKIRGYDFAVFSVELIKRTRNTNLFLIGPDPQNERWGKMKSETQNRARALGRLPREEFENWMKIADIYIPSFPMISGGHNEAMKYNVPIYMLRMIGRVSKMYKDFYYNETSDMINSIIKRLDNETEKDFYTPIITEMKSSSFNTKKMIEKIISENVVHAKIEFHSKRCISNEEIINYQLLLSQKKYLYIDNSKLSLKNKVYIFLFEKYFDSIVKKGIKS